MQNENLLKIIEELNVTQLNHLAESRAKIELKFANLHQKFIDSDDTLNNYFNKVRIINKKKIISFDISFLNRSTPVDEYERGDVE